MSNTATARIGDPVPSRHFIGRPMKVNWAPTKQRFQIAQALDVGDAEFAAGLVNQRVHLAFGRRPHQVNAEMHDALVRQPFGGGDIHAAILGRIFLAWEGAFVMASAKRNRAAFRHGNAGLFHRRLEIGRRDLGTRRDVGRRSMQIPGTMQFSSGYSLIGWPPLLKCLGASMWVPAWSGIDMNIDDSPCTLPGFAEQVLVGLPDAVDDGRVARIGRGGVVELAAEIDDLQDGFPLTAR